MLLTKTITTDSLESNDVKQLYESAFPVEERFPYDIVLELTKLPQVNLEAVYDKDIFIGFYLIIKYKSILYISFLAVTTAQRNKGYGSQMLSLLKEKYPTYDLLLDEEPVYENAENYQQRLNRKKFYSKNGFVSTNYIISAYGVDYEILTLDDNSINIDDYINIFRSVGFTSFNPEVKKYST